MTRQNGWSMAVVLVVILALGSSLRAADPAPTTITIPDMHCGGCVKSVAAKLVAVEGVAKAEANVEAKIITVTPKANVALSPKALWEAVESAKQKPMKLE